MFHIEHFTQHCSPGTSIKCDFFKAAKLAFSIEVNFKGFWGWSCIMIWRSSAEFMIQDGSVKGLTVFRGVRECL